MHDSCLHTMTHTDKEKTPPEAVTEVEGSKCIFQGMSFPNLESSDVTLEQYIANYHDFLRRCTG